MSVRKHSEQIAKVLSIFFSLGFILGALMIPHASARDSAKHPRATELEEHLRSQAQTHLQARFPNQPYSVLITVEPLFRYEPDELSDDSSRGEDLPGLFVAKEEIRDEWDDPATGLSQLLNRVRKIKVDITLPSQITDEETEEVKASISASLKLVTGRDVVEVTRKAWKGGDTYLPSNAVFYGGIIVLLLVFGQFIISLRSASRLAKALNPLSILSNQISGGGGGGMTTVTVNAANGGEGGGAVHGGGGGGGHQDVTMLDPVKLRDLIATKVDSLEGDSCFPTLEDMLILDETGARSSTRMSLIMEEFSPEVKNRIFALGSTQGWWLDAFYAQGGQVDYEALMILQRLSRVKRRTEDTPWQNLLVLVWRMEDKISGFVREIGEKRAVPILAAFPKSIAVPAAKKAFPGSWGILLNPALPEDRLPEKDIVEMTERAKKYLPLREPGILLSYKKERELITYLDRVDTKEEEEIYVALPESSNVSRLRPPFFRLFAQERDVVKKVVRKLDMKQIALCLYAVDSSQRMKILEVLNEKQSFMATESVGKLEKNKPDPLLLASTKKHVGTLLEQALIEIKQAPDQGMNLDTTDEEDADSDLSAAA